jgi:group I intron endonuclease
MIIYCITNKLNHKQYVGQTRQSLKERWQRHCWSCTKNSNMAISKAIAKYGKENFVIEEICRCSSIQELIEKEMFYIKLKNTLSPSGYNLTPGGETVIHLPETIKRIAEKNRGRLVSEETRIKLRNAGLGRKESDEARLAKSLRMKGKPLSKIAQERSRLANQKTYQLIDPSGSIQIICNMRQFCLSHGLSQFKMCELVNKKRRIYKGWRIG